MELPTGGNMRHRSRTDRTGRTEKMERHAKYAVTLAKIASFALRDGPEIATNGGALAGNS